METALSYAIPGQRRCGVKDMTSRSQASLAKITAVVVLACEAFELTVWGQENGGHMRTCTAPESGYKGYQGSGAAVCTRTEHVVGLGTFINGGGDTPPTSSAGTDLCGDKTGSVVRQTPIGRIAVPRDLNAKP